jgi:hypothetical protein
MNEQFVKCESVTFAQGGQERKDQDQHRHHRHQCQQGEPHGGPNFLPDQVQRNLQQQHQQEHVRRATFGEQFEEKEKCQQQEEFRTVQKGMMALPRQ